MLSKLAGAFKYHRPLVKVSGVWKDIDTGYVKVAGVWKKFKVAFVGKNITVVLGTQDGTDANGAAYQRRSFIRSGLGPAKGTPGAPYIGSISQNVYSIAGVNFDIRGVETGSDNVSGTGAWSWVSLQWFGKVPTQNLAPWILFNGQVAVLVADGYDATNDLTFRSYKWVTPQQLTAGTNLSISF